MAAEVLHTDDPTREGNLSAEQWDAKVKELRDEYGDEGLHIIPDEYLPKGAR